MEHARAAVRYVVSKVREPNPPRVSIAAEYGFHFDSADIYRTISNPYKPADSLELDDELYHRRPPSDEQPQQQRPPLAESRLDDRRPAGDDDGDGDGGSHTRAHTLADTESASMAAGRESSTSGGMAVPRSLGQLWRFVMLQQIWLFLVALGLSVALVTLTMDFAINYLIHVRVQLIKMAPAWWLQYFSFVLFNLSLSMLAGGIVRYVSPQAAGSGIPEMKSILSGVVLPRYLNFRTLMAKTTGLAAALAGGLSIGREGPTVHIASTVANQLCRLRIFRKIRDSEALRFQMLSAGCAVGVATSFGAPVGGVLFAIEVTSTYFLVSNMWKGFFASVAGALVVKLFGGSGFIAMFSTKFDDNPYQPFELALFALIGIACGYIGALFVRTVLKCVMIRRQYKLFAQTRYIQLIIIAILTASVMFPLELTNLASDDEITLVGDKLTLHHLFGDLRSLWTSPSVYLNLVIFFCMKWLFTSISLGLPIPCGLFTPVFIMGAAFGRFVGEVARYIVTDVWQGPAIIAGGYAVVGAAGLSAGVTRTLSTAVIVFELTGQLQYFMPVLIAVLLGTGVGNFFSRSAYDALLEQKRLPYMPPFGDLSLSRNVELVKDIMRTDVHYVTESMTYLDISNLLDKSHFVSYPLVDSDDNMVLKATIFRIALEKMVELRDKQFKDEVEGEILQQLGQTSSRHETLARLRTNYSFAASMTPDFHELSTAERGDEFAAEGDGDDVADISEEDLEHLLLTRRSEFFRVPITQQLSSLNDHVMDRSPFQVPAMTHIYKLHFMFAMLGLNHAYVTQNSRLVGVISKKQFLDMALEKNRA